MKNLQPILLSGREVLPLIEGGKGISVSNGESSGAWAASGGVGTFSGVNADSYDDQGRLIPQVYYGETRRERHEELIRFAIKGGIHQARVAHELASGQGRIHGCGGRPTHARHPLGPGPQDGLHARPRPPDA